MINIDELLNKIDVDKLIEDYGKKEPEHLDADGVPINIGDVLYFAGDKCAFPDRAYIVTGFEADYGVELKLPNGVLVYDCLDKYTHSRPDSWDTHSRLSLQWRLQRLDSRSIRSVLAPMTYGIALTMKNGFGSL